MSGSPKRSSHTDERSLAQPNALTSRPRGREAGAAPVELAASSGQEPIRAFDVSEITGRSVVVLGLARQGMAVVRYLCSIGANVTVSDLATEEQLRTQREELAGLPVTFALGGHAPELLDSCDLLILSGGVPPQIPFIKEAVARGIPLSNDGLLTLQLAHAKGLGPVIAVTGSSGKTTTTTLAGQMLAGNRRPSTWAAISACPW